MGTGAKPIKRYGTTNAGTAAYSSWNAGSVQCLVYDGTYERWTLLGWLNTTYSDFAGSSHGLVPASTANGQDKFLRGDGTWQNPPARMMQVATHETNDWVSYGQDGYQDAAAVGYSTSVLELDNFLAGDRFELAVGLTVGNLSETDPRHVLFHVDLCSVDIGKNEEKVDAVLASTIVSIPPVSGDVKVSYASATLNVLRVVTVDDIQDQCYIKIKAKEVSSQNGMSVRLYNTAKDYNSDAYAKDRPPFRLDV